MVEKALAPGISQPSGLESAHSSEDDQYLPSSTRLSVNANILMLAVFRVALDNTIMAVAITKITDQFHALNDVGCMSEDKSLLWGVSARRPLLTFRLLQVGWRIHRTRDLVLVFLYQLTYRSCYHCRPLDVAQVAPANSSTEELLGAYTSMSDDATVPARIVRQRSIAFASFFGLCIGAPFFMFQAIRGAFTVRSGIDSLPMVLANVIGIILSGALTTGLGYYAPIFVASSIITSPVGSDLFLSTDYVSAADFSKGGVAAQADLTLPDVSVGTAIIMFLQILGGALFTFVAQSLFTTKLTENLAALEISSLDSCWRDWTAGLVIEEQLPAVLDAYNGVLINVFQLALIMGCLSTVGAQGIECRSRKKSDGVASMQD
ncbi:hypothetical protein AN9382.2 [Aspergillus nidulans FGSC A4]|uniref:Uncharacterized protein n=1 Tax=Emericella nidulans (strain FGSC A4 / ATCC 38163 / CBS 112.46 / NRRL 194 / M139) TaxID=227321 RepID=Q5AQP8_EMENI|nr:hypothetical protein [Aspergillus nidulans FGSC A4]EAA66449.1 hypothetical protein AN9382.2 [Aspergillus nidulans FGSC A4]CBF87509.1 TPA: conserved hypothetical protein [Aspergillus nidulans FGSC A4]|eukprot:XP_682651.1 hypothetical protein AN9382.2 [Aspergillus nidulans FGSC A4]